MKSQDLVLLFKLHSLWASEHAPPPLLRTDTWKGWDSTASSIIQEPELPRTFDPAYEDYRKGLFTVRQLAASTGISKSQVNLSLHRSLESGIAVSDRRTGLPKVNAQKLYGLVIHAVRYMFPTKYGPISRGIPTAMAAPVLMNQILTSGDLVPVWPDPRGTTMGQSIEPLVESVSIAVQNDPMLYALLSLTDAIRIGQAREQAIAARTLKDLMEA